MFFYYIDPIMPQKRPVSAAVNHTQLLFPKVETTHYTHMQKICNRNFMPIANFMDKNNTE